MRILRTSNLYDSLRRRLDRKPPIANNDATTDTADGDPRAAAMIAAPKPGPRLFAAFWVLGLEHEHLDLEIALDVVGTHQRAD